jgi:hypothetical protein
MNYQDRTTSVISQDQHHTTTTKQYIITITDLDVINGRGSTIQNHIGNINYRAIVSSRKREYASAKKFQKIHISKEIVATVRNCGGRFLELDKCTQLYYDIGDVNAWAKTSQALRDTKKKIQVAPRPSYTSHHYQLTNMSHAQNNDVGEGADTSYSKLVHILSGKKRKEEEDGHHTTTADVVCKKKKKTKKSNHSFADKDEMQPSQLPSLPQLIQYTDSRNREGNVLQTLQIVPV